MESFVRKIATIVVCICAISSSAIAHELTRVRVLYSPSPDFTNAFVALDQGFFKKHGLDVELSSYVASSTTSTNMLVSGSADIAPVGPVGVLLTKEADLDLVLIQGAAMMPSEHRRGIFAKPEKGIKSAKDLEGKTFGMIILTGDFEITFHNWMEKNGADPSKVNLVQVPLNSMADFIKSDRIDAGIVATPFLEKIMADSGAKLIGDVTDVLPGPVMITSWGTTREYAQAHPDVIEAFQDSMNEATAYMYEHPNEAHEAMVKVTGMDRDLVFNTPLPLIAQELKPSMLDWWYDTMKSRSLIVGDFIPADLIYQAKN